MSRQSEAWPAWPTDTPPDDPYWAELRRYTSDPLVARAILDRILADHAPRAHGSAAGRAPGDLFGDRYDEPADLVSRLADAGRPAPHAPRLGFADQPARRHRPAAVRSPISPRRGRRPGTRRKVRPRDPLLASRWAWAFIRVTMGLIFLWVFADRLLGLGRPVAASHAWLNGGSPTRGYLATAQGPFAAHFHAMAGQPWADWLFMAGMAGVGAALVLGVGMRVAAASGAALMALIYLAGLPVESNPVLDQHVVYALVLVALALSRAGDTLGLGAWWSRTRLVQVLPALR